MKTNKLIYFLLAGLLVAGLSSCNDFLDEQPDNRTIIDSEEKAIKMLVSAYADSQPWLFLEMASDNTDNHAPITMAGAVSGRRAMNGAIRPKPTTKTPLTRGKPTTWLSPTPTRCSRPSTRWR